MTVCEVLEMTVCIIITRTCKAQVLFPEIYQNTVDTITVIKQITQYDERRFWRYRPPQVHISSYLRQLPCSTRSAMNNLHMHLFCIDDLHSVAVLRAKSVMFVDKTSASPLMRFHWFVFMFMFSEFIAEVHAQRC